MSTTASDRADLGTPAGYHIAIEPCERRVRVVFNGVTIADTRRARLASPILGRGVLSPDAALAPGSNRDFTLLSKRDTVNEGGKLWPITASFSPWSRP